MLAVAVIDPIFKRSSFVKVFLRVGNDFRVDQVPKASKTSTLTLYLFFESLNEADVLRSP